MAAKHTWISTVKSEFEKSALVSNTFFAFTLICLEKLVEVEFACPCDPNGNGWFAAAFFFVPAFMVIMLMMNIRGCKGVNCLKVCENLLVSFVPAVVWLILVFFDGRYFVCWRSSWSGSFVNIAEAAGQKWCKPDNQTLSSDSLIKTRQWFTQSQWIGMGMIIFLGLFVLGPYLLYKCCKEKKAATQRSDGKKRQQRRGHTI